MAGETESDCDLWLPAGDGGDAVAKQLCPWVRSVGAFRPGQQSTVFPSAPVGFVWPGDKGINKYGGMTVKYNHFAPRVGFAWSPGSSRNFSVHGGIGLYYNRSAVRGWLSKPPPNAPFALTTAGATATCGSPGFANPFVGVAGNCGITNPFPFTPPSPGANPDFSQYFPIGLGFNTEDPRFTAPRSTNFNLTIERQIDKATIVSVAYVGNRGRHEEGAINLNLAGQAPGVNPSAAAFNGGTCQTRILLDGSHFLPRHPVGPTSPQVAGATAFNLPVYGHPGEQLTEFNSKYDSLQVTLNRRFSRGLQVMAAYTWSRYFDQTSSLENSAFNFPGINSFDPRGMWAPSASRCTPAFRRELHLHAPDFQAHTWLENADR